MIVKCSMIGDMGVGKSCLMRKFLTNAFDPCSVKPTIGIEFGVKLINVEQCLPSNIPSNQSPMQKVKLQIWDTAGQEAFKSIVASYYRGNDIYILVYDITMRETFNNVISWLIEIKNHTGYDGPGGAIFHPIIVLVGNKCDDEEHRQVTIDEAKKFADIHQMMFFETSSKNSINIDSVFIAPIKTFINTKSAQNIDTIEINDKCKILITNAPSISVYSYKCCN